MAFAMGGPFMKGHVLVVYNSGLLADQPKDEVRVLFNGEPILTEADSASGAEFELPFVLWAARRQEWDTSMHDQAILEIDPIIRWAVGPWPERFSKTPLGGLFLFRLPNDIEVTVTAVDFLSVVVKMAPVAGQAGYCGNFNGDPSDDFEPTPKGSVLPFLEIVWNTPVGESVPDALNLFARHNSTSARALHAAARVPAPAPTSDGGSDGGSEQVAAPAATPLGGRRRPWRGRGAAVAAQVGACEDKAVLQRAVDACSKILDDFMRKACISDACLAGGESAESFAAVAAGASAEEALETQVNHRGIPVLVGQGRCLDPDGKGFEAIEARGVHGAVGCKSLLHDLASVSGVLGVQLRPSGSCEVVVDPSVDRVALQALAPKDGGWSLGGLDNTAASAMARQRPVGEGLVAAASAGDAPGGMCWRLN
mmetsp:Transcript_162166/g.520055  ORF Transcript_162166/g.520055 Transcript_162166/m.520055 type:complete len:424 (+) Transcript_162166:1024-2295(+)